jgi:Ca2+-binding RTX toxin-like protein
VVDNIADVVTEQLGGGIDIVQTSITYTLGLNIENLKITGNNKVNATGNELSNIMTGNSNNNVFDGGGGNDTLDGGAGADTMAGGAGDDIYLIDNAGDRVTELVGEGIDTVHSSISSTLGSNIESLILTGTGNINGTGNSSNNTITGNSGNNTLDGGKGIDILTGQGGVDIFVFSSKETFGSSTSDHITDFSSNDKIQISKSAFGITGTTFTCSSVSGASAVTASLSTNALFVYDTSSGYLYWNQNGKSIGAGRGGIFAILENKFADFGTSNINLVA